jgi:hypothetical protein
MIKILDMTNLSEKGRNQMTNGNGNPPKKKVENDNRHLQKLLQKAVHAEKAPDSLREKISRMIRE